MDSDSINSIKEGEAVIARALRAMFNAPGSQEDVDARTEYIKYKLRDRDLPKSAKKSKITKKPQYFSKMTTFS